MDHGFSALGVPTDRNVDEINEIDVVPRQVNAPELTQSFTSAPEQLEGVAELDVMDDPENDLDSTHKKSPP